jgi:hypothetical protein
MKKMKKNLTYLIASAAIMLLSFGAKAQNGSTPLVGSTHVYTVIPESSSNTLAWTVLEGADGTEYNIVSGAATGAVTIKWNTAGNYTVQFTETIVATGCATVKTATVVVSANTFDVSTADPTEVCNAADGQANYSGSTATTAITFKVDMTTDNTSFNPNWEITFTLNPGTATVANVAANGGTLSGTGPYTLTAITSASGNGTVNITMDVTGGIYAVQSVDLTITSAKELTYNTPDVDSDDWTATQTINAIPQTSAITTD